MPLPHALMTGVASIDDQHIDLFNRLHTLREAASNPQHSCGPVRAQMEELLSFLVLHFRTEESLMLDTGYPARDLHAKDHYKLWHSLLELMDGCHKDKGCAAACSEGVRLTRVTTLVAVVEEHHITKHDRAFARFLRWRLGHEPDPPPFPYDLMPPRRR